MTASVRTREGFTESVENQNGTEIYIYVVETYALSELDQSTSELSNAEILALGRAADGTPVPASDATRHGLTRPRFRVFRNMRSRHQAKVRVTWGTRYLTIGSLTTVQSQRSFSRDEPTLQPFLRKRITQGDSGPVEVIELDARRVDRLIISTVYRRLLPSGMTVAQADTAVRNNRRKYYLFGGVPKILERHDIVPANQTQLYIDTWFYDKSALPEVLDIVYGNGDEVFGVAEMPVLGEYIEPYPGIDTQTAVTDPEDLYEPGEPLPWL